MRLINPVRGTMVETSDPRTINDLVYGRGYVMVDDAQSTPDTNAQEDLDGQDLQA